MRPAHTDNYNVDIPRISGAKQSIRVYIRPKCPYGRPIQHILSDLMLCLVRLLPDWLWKREPWIRN